MVTKKKQMEHKKWLKSIDDIIDQYAQRLQAAMDKKAGKVNVREITVKTYRVPSYIVRSHTRLVASRKKES